MAGELQEFYPHNFVPNYDKFAVSDGLDIRGFDQAHYVFWLALFFSPQIYGSYQQRSSGSGSSESSSLIKEVSRWNYLFLKRILQRIDKEFSNSSVARADET